MKILHKHKLVWPQKVFWLNVIFGFALLAASLLINNYAQVYTASHISNAVTDILLDNLPVVDVHLIYSEGALVFFLFVAAVIFYEPKYLPFVLKSISLFIITRSFFMILTHLAPPANVIYINPTDYIQRFSHGDDLFFSGHTGMPFLMACIFWKHKFFRYLFLACTLIGGTAMILGHLHYSIDVFSALFISFGIFHIAKFLFPKDYELMAS